MKKLIYCLMAIVVASVMTSCELDVEVNGKDVMLSNIAIECIDETTISNNTSGDEPFTKHTYLCRGSISGYNGVCYIRVLHDNFIVHNNHELIIAGDVMPFEFTFAPEWGYLDEPYLNFIIEVYDEDNDTLLCKTTVVVTKHSDVPAIEPTNITYKEYTLYGSSCDWNLPNVYNNVIVVDSDEELARYITSESGESSPTVDFSKYTMIIAHGYSLNGISEKRIDSFQRVSATDIALNISIYRNLADVVEPWTIALLVDKWDKLYNIDLCVDYRELIN